MNPTRSKADIIKWNTDVVFGMAEEYGYTVKKHTDVHFSLFHPTKGRFDYFPSTGRGGWFNQSKTHGGKLKQYGKTIKIDDIEAYLMEHFNPNKPIKTDPIADLTKRIVDLEWRLRKLEALYFSNKTGEYE